ncbi:MAG TPA: hypothetical protein IGP91_05545 [Thermosynechococcus sp. M46_R2017_013]|nr:hypothetical protein [Thermosynechococcus sp. M46_R2017_013]
MDDARLCRCHCRRWPSRRSCCLADQDTIAILAQEAPDVVIDYLPVTITLFLP